MKIVPAPLEEKTHLDEPYYIQHLTDEHGLSVCVGLPIEPQRERHGAKLWMCTGCWFVTNRLQDQNARADAAEQALDDLQKRCIQADIEVKAQRNAAEQDAARLAEALRTAPVAVEQTPQTAAWEVQRHHALAAHRERTDPGPIGTLDVDEG